MERVRFIIGISSWNESENIERITLSVDQALQAGCFQPDEVLIVNADNGSTDKTTSLFSNVETIFPKKVIVSDKIGKGHNFRKLFELLVSSGADCLITVDADLEHVGYDWFSAYSKSIVTEGKAMALPNYFRYWFDGNLTNQIVYPTITGITGVAIRQPIGGEFAFSSSFASHLLQLEWDEWTYGFGIDVFCTLVAIRDQFPIDQVYLSGGKFHHQRSFDPEEMEREFDRKFLSVVGTTFERALQIGRIEPTMIRFPPPAITNAPSKDFDFGYIEQAADKALQYFQKIDYPTGIWPTIDYVQDLDDGKWVDVLITVYCSVKENNRIDENLFKAFRRLFYIRIVSALSTYTDKNIEKRLQEMIWQFYQRIT